MAQMIFDPSKYTVQRPKPLPVILMLDASDSMNFVDGNNVEFVEGGITRISVLNDAVRRMLRTLATYERENTEFLVSIITFGADTRLLMAPVPARDVSFTDLRASGETPLGPALAVAKKLVEDREQIPSRAYRPLVVLVSDGEPDVGWEAQFESFVQEGRSSKCDRMALAIGKEADRKMLGQFVEGTGHAVQEAETAEEITKFFKFVTMSTVQRTLSQNPNETPRDADVVQPAALAGKSDAAPKTVLDDDEGYW